MKLRHLILILLFSLKAVGQVNKVKVGDEIPSFTVSLKNGKTINSSSLCGKIVLINFFTTWCEFCLKEIPALENEVWKKYKSNKDFRLLAIGIDQFGSSVQAFKNNHDYDLPMYSDETKTIYSLFATKSIPRNYIIDKTGKIVYASAGYNTKEFKKMLKILDELVK